MRGPDREGTPMAEPTVQQREWPAFAGIDWGGSHHQLCVLDTTGKRLTQLRVTHDVAGLADLDTELARHGDGLPVAVERSEGLLVEHLQARGHPVFPVSPRIAARARERYRVAAVEDEPNCGTPPPARPPHPPDLHAQPKPPTSRRAARRTAARKDQTQSGLQWESAAPITSAIGYPRPEIGPALGPHAAAHYSRLARYGAGARAVRPSRRGLGKRSFPSPRSTSTPRGRTCWRSPRSRGSCGARSGRTARCATRRRVIVRRWRGSAFGSSQRPDEAGDSRTREVPREAGAALTTGPRTSPRHGSE
jgi:Transposase